MPKLQLMEIHAGCWWAERSVVEAEWWAGVWVVCLVSGVVEMGNEEIEVGGVVVVGWLGVGSTIEGHLVVKRGKRDGSNAVGLDW